jgi:hypothetical protein
VVRRHELTDQAWPGIVPLLPANSRPGGQWASHRRLHLRIRVGRIDHAVQQLVLVGHVLVQRNRHDAELLGELAHAECVDTAVIGQGDGGAQNPLLAQGHAGLCVDVDLRGHSHPPCRS